MREFIPGGPPRYAHQRRGLQRLIETRGVCALLFDPGLGKTATVLDYISVLALRNPGTVTRVLVAAPLAAVDTWVMQAPVYLSPDVDYLAEALGGSITQRAEALAARGRSDFALHRGRSILVRGRRSPPGEGRSLAIIQVLNLDTFSSRAAVGRSRTKADLLLEAVRAFDPELVVVDESHRIKSASSNVSRLMARIGRVVPRRVILTGTVMPHSPMDVYAQWRFLAPEAFGATDPSGKRKPATYTHFRDRFARMGGFMGRQVLGYRNLDDLRAIMAENAVVARKSDALDLPPTTDVVVPVELTARERRVYADMKKQLAAVLGPGTTATVPNRLTQMLRLRQVTAGFLPDDSGTVQAIGRSKVATIASIVNDSLAGESRVVVFGVFRRELAELTAALQQPGTEVMLVTGDTPQTERMTMRSRFGSDDPARLVMVSQIKTMSLAVNELVTASHAVFASLSQQRDDLIQARDRLNRIGQTKPVTFWYALAPGTVDEVIMRAHQDRTDLEAAMLRHLAEHD